MSGQRARKGSSGPRGLRGRSSHPPEYLLRLGLQPRKALGQNFLIDELALSSIAEACGLDDNSTVLEIGAGPGGLTDELASRAGHVVAVELDEELAVLARGRLAGAPGVCVIAADILDFTPEELLAECELEPPYIACGNLPYYITQPIVRRLLEAERPPTRIVVMAQREVARRIVGGAGRESLLSMTVRCYGTAEPVLDLPATAFWPAPKVQSSVIRIEMLPEPQVDRDQLPRLMHLMRAGFTEPRKQLHNTLRSALDLSRDEAVALLEAGEVDPARRAQHLDLDDWRRLLATFDDRQPGLLDAG
ncbi:MAG TPA: 16S rRNA (adenine(1518)-N(6)/adenine(1519)-N(6))-dimethyltransferase RsmA [Dehalococcoidia bacterium]|nr:16S rRNA (adenine(1518)-N(6)/adenine(1519)-N(6))-dimethyltransferase RsmA [Dehalococcoidia bacterium]